MKLKAIHGFEPFIKRGQVIEIDNIMRDPNGSASGVKVRVLGVWKKPTWIDLGFFVAPVLGGKVRSVARPAAPEAER